MQSRDIRQSAAALLLGGSVVLSVAACGGPTLPALTDPTEIVTVSLASAQAAKSFHVDVTVDGSITADLTGTGGSGTSLPLTGTVAAADVDVANKKAHATFAIPSFLNFTGEVIQIGKVSYLRSSLGGTKFEESESTDSLPIDVTDPSAMFEEIRGFLGAEGVDPVKNEDVDCGDTSCYSVTIELTPKEIAALGGAAVPTGLPIDIGAASLNLNARVEKDTQRLSGLTAVVSLGGQGSVTIVLALSKWDEATSISAPPADQIETGS
jgi:hypothetical protein